MGSGCHFARTSSAILGSIMMFGCTTPHELMRFLFDDFGLYIPDLVLKNYWRNYRALSLPGGSPPDGLERIPLKFFGDDAQYNQQGDKLLAFVLSLPLWRPKVGRNSRFTVCCIPLKLSLGYETCHPILSKIVWSLNKLYDEELPMSKLRFQVHEVSGDWKYMREVFNMSTHWNAADQFCHFCSLNRLRMACLQEALPMPSTARFIRDVMRQPISPLILLRAFHVGVLQWCLLHNLHLGLLWTANGASMDLLLGLGIFDQPPGLPLARQLQDAYAMFKDWLKAVGAQSSQRCFTIKMVCKARHGAYMSCMGWNSRLLAAWMADVLKDTLEKSAASSAHLMLTTHAMPRISYYIVLYMRAKV